MAQELSTYTLSRPVDLGEGEFLTVLSFRECTAGDIEDMAFPPKGRDYLQLAARLSGQPYPIIKKITGQDAIGLIALVSGFFDGGPETGGTI